MWNGNGMHLIAQQKAQDKLIAENTRIEELRVSFSTKLTEILEGLEPINKWQKRPTLLELLSHIQKKNGYKVGAKRWQYLDSVLIDTKLKIFQKNGIPVSSVDGIGDAEVFVDVKKIVKILIAQIESAGKNEKE